MKRSLMILSLGLALFAPAVLSGCGDEKKDEVKKIESDAGGKKVTTDTHTENTTGDKKP